MVAKTMDSGSLTGRNKLLGTLVIGVCELVPTVPVCWWESCDVCGSERQLCYWRFRGRKVRKIRNENSLEGKKQQDLFQVAFHPFCIYLTYCYKQQFLIGSSHFPLQMGSFELKKKKAHQQLWLHFPAT